MSINFKDHKKINFAENHISDKTHLSCNTAQNQHYLLIKKLQSLTWDRHKRLLRNWESDAEGPQGSSRTIRICERVKPARFQRSINRSQKWIFQITAFILVRNLPFRLKKRITTVSHCNLGCFKVIGIVQWITCYNLSKEISNRVGTIRNFRLVKMVRVPINKTEFRVKTLLLHS